MWKESYKTGVAHIDCQHKMLFDKSDQLLHAIEHGLGPDSYKEIIGFLKEYVVTHFRDEEAYQLSIHHSGYEAHKKAHQAFTNTVDDFAVRLEAQNYPLALVQELAGTLSAWLIYHVAYTDQRMVNGVSDDVDSTRLSTIQIISASMCETLQALTGLPSGRINESDASAENVSSGTQVDIGLFGDINGTLTYLYTDEVAKSLFATMTMQNPKNVDGMVRSALSEITNIATGNTTIKLTRCGIACDIMPPQIAQQVSTKSFEGVVLNTGSGKLKICANLDRY